VVTVGYSGETVVIPTEYGKVRIIIPPQTFENSTQLVLANASSAFRMPAPGKSAVASFFVAVYKNGAKVEGEFQNPLRIFMDIPFVQSGDSVYIQKDGGWEPLAGAIVERGRVSFQITSDPVITILGRKGSPHPIILPRALGGQVSLLQKQLSSRGLPVVVDGIYGPETKKAVVAFQVRSKLRGNGIIGPRTWAMLLSVAPNSYPKIAIGSNSDAVTTLRTLLHMRGYRVSNHGKFDISLENAVKKFQKRHGIRPTGVVKRSTWLKIGVQ
jgi:murein L,D-transpeptidase YcbB/YkuD